MEDLGFEEPLGILYLSARCRENGHKVFVAENNATRIEEKICAIDPDLLAVSVLTPSFAYLYETIKRIKGKYDIPTVFGGPHATFFPEIIEKQGIDYVFRGECEEAFVDFLDLLEAGEAIDGASNLVFMNGDGEIEVNALTPLTENLDTLSFPDRELFLEHRQFYESDVRSVIASRGCPYHCSYCFNKEYQKLYKGLGRPIRVRSVDNVVEECIELKEGYGARMFHFFDDIFPFNSSWIEQFSAKYSEKVGLPFLTNTSFSVCTKQYVSCLSKAGCKSLLIGVETGNEVLRDQVLFRKMSNKMMIERCRLIHSHGIKVYTQNLIGIPKGSLEMDLETLRLNIKLKADYAGAYLCQPYPKTAIERIAREANLIDESKGFGRSFYYSSNLLISDKEKIEKLRVLFPIVVNFPFLYNSINALMRLPAFFFKTVGTLLHGYKIKTAMLIYPMSLSSFVRNVGYYLARRINRI
jgi:radical SAM superfamily enzyme YgiQ (UPF0313 family)